MLRATNIHYSFANSQKVLKGISCAFEAGEITTIVGTTGAGKTTLLKCLGGFYDLSKGKITLDNEPVLGPDFNLIPGHPKIKHVAQDFNLLPNHTVYENVISELHQYYKYEKKEIGNRLLKAFRIWELRNTLPRLLSGGQQQRVALAKTLAEKPHFLLLDEPFNQQDSWNKDEVLSAIKSWAKQEKIGVVLVTHQYEDALYLADQIIVLEKGKIVQTDTPEMLYFHPKNERIAKLFGNYILLDGNLYRPTQFELSDRPTLLKAEVLRSEFKGNRFEIVLQIAGQELRLVRPQAVASSPVFLRVKN